MSVRKDNNERLRCNRLSLNLFFVGSNTLGHHTHLLYHRIMVNMVETCLSLVDHVSRLDIVTFECSP